MAASSPVAPESPFDPRHGEAVTVAPGIRRVIAPNASPYTFTGTNSYVVGDRAAILIDPGPDDPRHLEALSRALAGRAPRAVVLTHTHRDHCALARKAAEHFDVPIWSSGPHRLSRPLKRFEPRSSVRAGDFSLVPDRLLGEGDTIETDAGDFVVLETPGHCANHIALLDKAGAVAIVGDHVMGWSSTLVSVPDGDLLAYLASLEALAARPHRLYLPGHGPEIADGPETARQLLARRRTRSEQIVAAVGAGAVRLNALMAAIYPGLPEGQIRPARRTLVAHLEALARERRIRLWSTPFGPWALPLPAGRAG